MRYKVGDEVALSGTVTTVEYEHDGETECLKVEFPSGDTFTVDYPEDDLTLVKSALPEPGTLVRHEPTGNRYIVLSNGFALRLNLISGEPTSDQRGWDDMDHKNLIVVG